ncbi:MAG: transglycosylase SLT domain-containing protein [Proteobacteria bacterium]|nr:transglycosylase SLT domain-containing protein [Pseudomonadota bacterium]
MNARVFKFGVIAGLASLLGACAVQPVARAPVSVAIPAPATPAPVLAPMPATAAPDLWAKLRSSFVLDDCGEPDARSWAKKLTHDPARFSAQLAAAQPMLGWVQAAAERAGVPGEFALLPMVESSYNPSEPGRHGDPAGMWQIMPRTARSLGLQINREYDGRLDPVASTEAVLAMLKKYHDELHDWRLADMAFNAGEYKITGLVEQRGENVDARRLPVSGVTHDHLAKLIAMACIVRDPEKFNVSLPPAERDDGLTLVVLPQPMELALAARLADLSPDRLHDLNPGYRSARMPDNAPHHLLLPQAYAERLADAMDARDTAPTRIDRYRNLVASVAPAGPAPVSSPSANVDPPSKQTPSADAPPADHSMHVSRHRVARGESLWSIARRYNVSPSQLRLWNALASDQLKPGQSLLVSQPD